MNSLFKKTLVSVAVLQSGLSFVSMVQAAEVMFQEESVGVEKTADDITPSKSEVIFRESAVLPKTGSGRQVQTETIIDSGTSALPIRSGNEVQFTEESSSDVKGELTDIVPTTTNAVVENPAPALQPTVTSNLEGTEKNTVAAGASNAEVLFKEEPHLATVLPARQKNRSESETVESEVIFKESVNLPTTGSGRQVQTEAIVNVGTTVLPIGSGNEVQFTEESGSEVKGDLTDIVPTTTNAVVENSAPALQPTVTSNLEGTEKNTVAADASNAEVLFKEEPHLATALPARQQNRSESEAVEALEEQVKKKVGTPAFSSKTERNSLAVLRQQQAKSDVPQQQGRLILLTNVEVEGNTVIDDATLAEISNPFVGRRIKLSDLEELRVRLTNAYTEQGYINSGVLLPDQKVENGNLVFKVIEGKLGDITIEGAGSLREKYITDRVLKGADKPFNSFALQENFQLLLDDPLFERMDGKLRTLPDRGISALDLKITRARPYDLSVIADNHGTPSLGSEQLSVAGVVRNITGFGDVLGVTASGNGSKFNVTTEYEIPVRRDDTRVKVRLTGSNSTVIEEPLDTIDIDSNSVGAEFFVTRPWTQSIRKSGIAGAGISIRESSNTLEGVPFSFSPGEVDGRSRVTAARVWQEYVLRGDQNVLAARGTLNVGLDMFGSTIHDDDLPDSGFLSAQAQLQYVRRAFDERAQIILRLEGQIANNELLPLERFSLGGANTVRGFRENELVRDQAAFASAELRYPIFNSSDFGAFQVAPFVDLGFGRNNGFFEEDEVLASIGLGLLWDYRSNFHGELYFGAGIDNDETPVDEDLQDRGIHLKLVAEF